MDNNNLNRSSTISIISKFKDIENYRKSTLIDFSVLFDTDIGCCLYLFQKSKRDFFEPYIFDATYNYIRYMVLTRKEKNPIKFMFKREYKENADRIYNQLLEKKWEDVVKRSPITDILKLILSLKVSNIADIVINCRNEIEKNRILTYINNDLEVKINETDLTQYFVIYAHDIEDLLKLNLKEKVVNLYGYARNYAGKDIRTDSLSELCVLFANTTRFTIIPPFSDFILPEG